MKKIAAEKDWPLRVVTPEIVREIRRENESAFRGFDDETLLQCFNRLNANNIVFMGGEKRKMLARPSAARALASPSLKSPEASIKSPLKSPLKSPIPGKSLMAPAHAVDEAREDSEEELVVEVRQPWPHNFTFEWSTNDAGRMSSIIRLPSGTRSGSYEVSVSKKTLQLDVEEDVLSNLELLNRCHPKGDFGSLYGDPEHLRTRALQRAIDDKKNSPFSGKVVHQFAIELPAQCSTEIKSKLKLVKITSTEVAELLCLEMKTLFGER